jgi:hypothetical protein
MLSCLLSLDENHFRLNKRAWEVVRMMSVAKLLSLETLDEMSELIFSYLIHGLNPTVTAEMLHLRYSLVSERIKDEMKQMRSQEGLDVVQIDDEG